MTEGHLWAVRPGQVLAAGAVAAILDFALACAIGFGVRGVIAPAKVLQGIASGAIGPDVAAEGGWRIWAAGAVLHFTIALIWAAIYAVSTRRIAPIRALRLGLGPARSGLLFGFVVWAAMRFLVVPLSHARSGPLVFSGVLVAMVTGHMLLVGLPIALISERR
ncbi:MAG: hypothetical protein V4503_10330 [Gemmatimonadota bacterium]